jgi:hypothetical protein
MMVGKIMSGLKPHGSTRVAAAQLVDFQSIQVDQLRSATVITQGQLPHILSENRPEGQPRPARSHLRLIAHPFKDPLEVFLVDVVLRRRFPMPLEEIVQVLVNFLEGIKMLLPERLPQDIGMVPQKLHNEL